jgi:hypothetical protein
MSVEDQLAALLKGAGHPFDLAATATALTQHSVDVRDVRRVLIGNTWYDVHDCSFQVDAYGFAFRSADVVICGPTSSVQAIAASSAAPSVGERQFFSPGRSS